MRIIKLSEVKELRIGFGYDVHKLCKGRKLIIGGEEIPFELGLLGHSDADVLLHSISDALLGAAALGDIGQHFPDSDIKYSGADSMELLKIVCRMVRDNGFRISNIDACVAAQRPKLALYINKMRSNIAAACDIDVSCVNVKATTEEGLGFTGAMQGIASYAVALIE